MIVKINSEVQNSFPGLKVHFVKLDTSIFVAKINNPGIEQFTATSLEKNAYKRFRSLVAGSTPLAVERLRQFHNASDLPRPDPITAQIIKVSYVTDLPITVFSCDEFDSVTLRFAEQGEIIRDNNTTYPLKRGALIADTPAGILGHFGIKSSRLGKISRNSKSIVILSFGVDKITNKKSRALIEYLSKELQQIPTNPL